MINCWMNWKGKEKEDESGRVSSSCNEEALYRRLPAYRADFQDCGDKEVPDSLSLLRRLESYPSRREELLLRALEGHPTVERAGKEGGDE